MKTSRIRLPLLFCLLLAGATAAFAASKAKTEAPAEPNAKLVLDDKTATELTSGVREPAIRHFDPKTDRDVLKRIRYFKGRLPEEFRYRNNFAWARADIPGLPKKEYYAHSRIQSLDGLSYRARRKISGISPLPAKDTARFETLFVDYQGHIGGSNAIPRYYDTEYKILEDIAARLGTNSAVTGHIQLYTDLEACPSCRGVMRQFLAFYTNVDMEVLYDWP